LKHQPPDSDYLASDDTNIDNVSPSEVKNDTQVHEKLGDAVGDDPFALDDGFAHIVDVQDNLDWDDSSGEEAIEDEVSSFMGSLPKLRSKRSLVPVIDTETGETLVAKPRYALPQNPWSKSAGSSIVDRFAQSVRTRRLIETKILRRRKIRGRTLINNYRVMKDLGAGSFGRVKLCEDQVTGKVCRCRTVVFLSLRFFFALFFPYFFSCCLLGTHTTWDGG
jgi:hypothetical protein